MESWGHLDDTENHPPGSASADDTHRQSDSIHRLLQTDISPKCIVSADHLDQEKTESVRQGHAQFAVPTSDRTRSQSYNSTSTQIHEQKRVSRFFESKTPSDGGMQCAAPEVLVKLMENDMNSVVLPKYGSGSDSEQPPTICKVPDELKGSCEYAYRPVAVELGLFAPGGDHALQAYKWCCLRRLISRHHLLQEPERTPVLLRRCLDALNSLKPCIQSSYHPRYGSGVGQADKLLCSMLLDGCFILHRLLKYAHVDRAEARSTSHTGNDSGGEKDEEDDDWTQVFGRCWVWGIVTWDLLLLENQIPFFVLQKLFQQLRTDPDESSGDILMAGALRLFRSLQPWRLNSSPVACHDVHHLLHLFYISVGLPEVQPGDPRKYAAPPSELPQWIPCARELKEAGVKFRARKDGKSFLDMKFHGGVLEIPALQLYDYSEPLFRNLIAFEQTYPFTPGHVTAYAIFMDCLVTSPEDMRLLHLGGVLVNQMNGERDGTRFFSRLCAEAHLAADRNYLAGVIQEMNRYQQSRWPRWRAALVRNYFSNPWVAMSLVAAILLLALTVMQSFFAAYAYFKPPEQQ